MTAHKAGLLSLGEHLQSLLHDRTVLTKQTKSSLIALSYILTISLAKNMAVTLPPQMQSWLQDKAP